MTEGLSEPGIWQPTAHRQGESNYPYLVYPITDAGGDVLVDVEHERCPYDGVSYVRQGKINGTHPLLTVNHVGRGFVIRHYAAVNPKAVFGISYEKLLANLIQFAVDHRSSR